MLKMFMAFIFGLLGLFLWGGCTTTAGGGYKVEAAGHVQVEQVGDEPAYVKIEVPGLTALFPTVTARAPGNPD